MREGLDFGVVDAGRRRWAARWSRCRGCAARYDELFLPLYGAHQAQNAAVALAAVEAFVGGTEPLDDDLVRAAFAEVTSPGRLEIVRTGPTIVLDAAHNPHGAAATAAALEDSFTLDPLIGVIGVMGDKDAEGLLAAFEPHLAHVVCTQNSTERAMPADELAVVAARGLRRGPGHRRAAAGRRHRRGGGAGRGRSPELLDRCRRRADHRFGRHGRRGPVDAAPETVVSAPQPERSPRRGMCAAVLSLEAITLGLTTPVHDHGRRRGPAGRAGHRAGARGARACSSPACCATSGATRSGWLVQLGAIGLGFVIGLMFFLGTVFALLWATAYLLGRKIERERAAAYAAFEAEQP